VKAKKAAGAPKPGPEHQKLAYFVGKWAHHGEMKPGSFGSGDPGGKFAYRETCKWLEGRFALVGRSEGKTPEGTMKGLSIATWDPAGRTYTYFESNSVGELFFSRGSVRGKTWTWNNASKRIVNGKAVRTRLTLKQVSRDSATYKFEMGAPGKQMKIVMEGKQTRMK
jgi:Protein of unknown function (DUF1579)